MSIEEFKKNIHFLKNDYTKLKFKIEAINFAIMNHNIENYGEDEVQVVFEENRVIEEYLYKEKELIYFISQFLNSILESIYRPGDAPSPKTDIEFPPFNNTFSYYFDSLITQLYLIFESDQRVQLQHYFNNDKIIPFYPNRDCFGLWWEVYMLRNRVVHYTKNRYVPKKEKCACYETFSSRCNIIRIDKNGNIFFNTTLIDIYKDKYIENKIKESIASEDNTNPFELLFPQKSATGHNKKRPSVVSISDDINFDYASSGIRLLNEVNTFLNEINNMFFKYLYNQLKGKKDLINNSIALFIDGKEKIMSIKELYNTVIDDK